jgi:hypothetical protein
MAAHGTVKKMGAGAIANFEAESTAWNNWPKLELILSERRSPGGDP